MSSVRTHVNSYFEFAGNLDCTVAPVGDMSMRVVRWVAYGSPRESLELGTASVPGIASADEVLIKVVCSTVFAGDCEMRRLGLPLLVRTLLALYVGWSRPKRVPVLGQEFSGVVQAVGGSVTRYRPGDHVFGTTGGRFGAYAEYIVMQEIGSESRGYMAIKPESVSFEGAAAIPLGGLEALYFTRQAAIQSGQSVLIIGAAGDIGSFAIQLAKLSGATVTGVDAMHKLSNMLAIGADRTVDYTTTDVTTQDEKYDVVLDVLGICSLSGCMRILKPSGRLLVGNFGNFSVLHVICGKIRAFLSGGKKVLYGTATPSEKDLTYLAGLVDTAAIRSVVDVSFPLDEIVEAHEFVESGRKTGSVAIRMTN